MYWGRCPGCARVQRAVRTSVPVDNAMENAARAVCAVRGQVPSPGSLPPEVPTSLGTHSPEYLPP